MKLYDASLPIIFIREVIFSETSFTQEDSYVAVSINTTSSCTKLISGIAIVGYHTKPDLYRDDSDQLCSLLFNSLVFEPYQFSSSSSGT